MKPSHAQSPHLCTQKASRGGEREQLPSQMIFQMPLLDTDLMAGGWEMVAR